MLKAPLPTKVAEFLQNSCQNWKKSEKNVDVVMGVTEGCATVSAGTLDFELVPSKVMDSVFKYVVLQIVKKAKSH